MKKLAILGLLVLELAVSGCGSSNTTATAAAANGIWQANITGGAGAADAIDFITSFTVNGDNSLKVSSLVFLTANTCFASGASASGTLDITSGTNTTVTGTFSFTVTSGSPAGNTLTLSNGVVTGTLSGSTISGGTITGNWNLTGGMGCTGSGSFTLKQS